MAARVERTSFAAGRCGKVIDRYSFLSESPKGSSNPTAERWQLALAAGAPTPETERPRIRNLG